MKLLSIVWYNVLPPKYGGQKVITFFNKYLAAHFPLACLCSRNNQKEDNLSYTLIPELPLSKWQFINPLCWQKIIRVSKKENATHIIIEHCYHGIAGWLCKALLGTKLIVHSHNIEHTRFQQQGKWWWWLLKAYEKWTHHHADLNLFKTNSDMCFAIAHFNLKTKKCIIVPYGVEGMPAISEKFSNKEMICKKHSINKEDKILLFAGTLDYKPNAKAVEDIFNKLLPKLSANKKYKLIICGRNKQKDYSYLSKLSHPAVIYAGEVDDIEQYYFAADTFINPLLSSSGIQTKTIDALYYGLNVVCFDSNLEGIPVEFLKDKLFITQAGDWVDFVAKIEEACNISVDTPSAFYEEFGWEKVVGSVKEYCYSLDTDL